MFKYIDYQLLLAIIAIPIILVVLFPSPYYHVWYDSEPDYIANTLGIYINNHPVDYIHPELIINYISSFFVHLAGSFDSMESIVKSLRMVLIYFNLLIIYLAANSSAKTLTKNLESFWTNQFNYEVDYSTDNFTDIKAIFLKIKT